MKKNLLALLLALALMTAVFAGCGSGAEPTSDTPEEAPAATKAPEAEPEQPADTPAEPEVPEAPQGKPANELPLTDDDEPLEVFAVTNSNVTSYITELGNHQIYQKAEEMTGVHIAWQAYMMENANASLSLMFASGDLTDMIRFGTNGYPSGLAGALEEDLIIDLTDNLAEFAPSYSYILDSDKQVNLDVRTDDGDVLGFYTIYSLNGGYDISISRGPMMRQDLLDSLGVDAPSNYDELTDVLLAFKTEYGLSDPIWIGNSGFTDDSALIGGYDVTNDFYQIDGTIHYGPLEDGFKEYLEMMNGWYKSGILNSDFISYEDNPKSPANESLKFSGQAGMHYSSGSDMDNYNNDSTSDDPNFYLSAVPFIAGKDGINHFAQDTFAVKTMGCMTVTTQCRDVELAIKWCDFWYSDEGGLISNYGLEGQTFEFDENGEPHWTEFVTNNPDDISYTICRQIYLTLTQQPGLYYTDMELEMLSDNGKKAIETWNSSADGAYLIPGSYSMNAEESERYGLLMSDIKTLNDENWIKFITGDKSLDEYDDYVDMLISMGIEDAMEIYQTALNRYYAR